LNSFKNRKAFRTRVESDFFLGPGNDISPYDNFIRVQANSIKWDWRLLAAMIYKESQFDPAAVSWAGARGLMQIMPTTAKELGLRDPFDPAQSIRAGAVYLRDIENIWRTEVADSIQRKKMVLASYNAGLGHVQDARRLAAKEGANPDIWDESVANCMLLLSRPEYYNDETVRYGYVRGSEPYNYVYDIFEIYNHYSRFVSAGITKQ